ncbi:MAG: heparinase II/III family protein [Candidatus Delongbacteria bacterium]|nr:heparinase II/III family protein [Candidatus Delongbacteria bacterium]
MKHTFRIFIIGFAITLILLFAPVLVREFYLVEFDLDYSAVKQLPDFEIRSTRILERSIKISDSSLKNHFFFQSETSDFPPIQSEVDQIWDQKSQIISNTHELYVHSLYILWDLLMAHKHTRNDDYLRIGQEIIESWIKHNPRWDPFNTLYVWWDHSTAERSIAILHFVDYAKNFINLESEFIKLTNSYFNYAARYLANPQNYIFRHNHGIFEDIALIMISKFIAKDEIKDKYGNLAINRFENQVLGSFSEKGFHLENSPGYHLVVTRLCNYFLHLASTDYSIKNEVSDIIAQANENIPKLKMPNSQIPAIGDTNWLDDITSYPENFDFLIADSTAGYFITRSTDQYLICRTQGIYDTHQHDDALSFIYCTDNDLIVDETGFLDYRETLQSVYSKSKQAHNCIFPNSVENLFTGWSFIRQFNSNPHLKFVKLECLSNVGKITRRIVMNEKQNSLTIFDNVVDSSISFLQLFHISHTIKDVEMIDCCLLHLTTQNNRRYLIYSNIDFQLVKGQENPFMGWKAIPFDKLIPVYTIKKILGHDDHSITHISEIKGDQNILLEIDENSNILKKKNIDFQKKSSFSQITKPDWGTQYFRRVEVFTMYLIGFFISFVLILILSRVIKSRKSFILISLIPNLISIAAICYVVFRHIN